MKIANCIIENFNVGFCVLRDELVVPISSCIGIKIDDIYELIENWNDIKIEIEKKIDESEGFSIEKVRFLPPISSPRRNIICIGKNYYEHAKELEGKTTNISGVPKEPIYFSKMAYKILGPEEVLVIDPSVTNQVDYEVELGIIIGKKGKNITLEEAKEYIFGYSVFNDYSARDLQVKHVQWHRGKSIDNFTAMGPYIITADEIAFPPRLNIKCSVNDEVRQNSLTDNLMFPIDYILEDFSKGITLIPGDIIITGTPSGVGMGFEPPRYLNDGDLVVSEIEELGKISNRVLVKK